MTVNTGSTLDIINNHLLIDYGTSADPISTIKGYLKSGYAGGAWNGVGIDSSAAQVNAGFAVGYADGADGIATGITSGQIEVKYTRYGDANLDGVVNGDDFAILIGHLNKIAPGWDDGDFNYDGVVNGDDFALLVNNLGRQANGADVALPATDLAAINAFAAANGLAAVPEPASLSLLSAGAFSLLARRRKR